MSPLLYKQQIVICNTLTVINPKFKSLDATCRRYEIYMQRIDNTYKLHSKED